MRGKVVWFDVKKGIGFIRSPENKEDVFVHYSKIVAPFGEFKVLDEGDMVEFEIFHADRGNGVTKAQARDVKVIEQRQSSSMEA